MSGDFIGRPEWEGLHAVRAAPEYLETLELNDAARDIRRLLDAWDYVERESERMWSFLREAEGVRSCGSFLSNRGHLLKTWQEATFQR